MIYISIPVHEKPEVIINQLVNLKKYLNGKIVLHLSLTSSFTKNELLALISKNALTDDVLINPSSVKTAWGSIINAHLSNIDFLETIGVDDSDNVIFHSSNDMLVKHGLDDHLSHKKNIFHTRYVDRNGYWWPTGVALDRDIEFQKSLARVGSGRIVASQIEGSMYEFGLLKEINTILKKYSVVESSTAFYPREEFYFSSFAHALGVKPCSFPYIYSEVHIFDALLWKVFATIDSSPLPSKEKIKHYINLVLFKSRFYKITPKKINQVISGSVPELSFTDGGNIWIPYNQKDKLFGVKRVEREINDSLRKYITNEIK
ncbi:hypothetical protein SAMN05518863_104444 [Candidatus Pantoea symbiotica]|jgi:hypothetical protein|uniref:Glycosyltransferase n=1 Tax=Candidatus Pantoea symbiotica TaxID=1884370 RepID=A0A1I3WWQ7_9GAMM|nr:MULTISPECIES: hypothetical protein [Pantoea]KAJ9432542.1 hypothetical protein PMI39_009440 [Pantoea sp. YR343]SFK11912.1 hypothetical protein SAMN05518863_104444 [Pantoea symbiotica]SFU75989.1 hypothetical protein SAMN05518864_104444 [Pantoea sp. YR525]